MLIRFILLVIGLHFGATAFSAENRVATGAEQDQTLLGQPKQFVPVPLTSGPNDSNIARVVSMILERGHYLRQPLDDEISTKFLDRYLDSFDNLHIYFTKSDLDEFEKYRTRLDDLTEKEGDTTPARIIFTRFLERLQQQHDYVTNLLATEKFDFTGDDRFVLNRKTL